MKKEKRKVTYKNVEYDSIAECVRENEELSGLYCYIKKHSRTLSTVEEILEYRQRKCSRRVTRTNYLIESDYPITKYNSPSIRMDDSYIERNRMDSLKCERRLRHEQQCGIAARKREDKQSREYFESRGHI